MNTGKKDGMNIMEVSYNWQDKQLDLFREQGKVYATFTDIMEQVTNAMAESMARRIDDELVESIRRAGMRFRI